MTHSEQQVGGTLTDSMLHEIMAPGYLPDISALNVQMDTGYEGWFHFNHCLYHHYHHHRDHHYPKRVWTKVKKTLGVDKHQAMRTMLSKQSTCD